MWHQQFIGRIQKALDAGNPFRVGDLVAPCKITGEMRRAFTTGNFSPKDAHSKRGVAQHLLRNNARATGAHMNGRTTNIEKSSKATGPRELGASKWGHEDPYATPEGSGCGLRTENTLFNHIRAGYPQDQIRAVVEPVVALYPGGGHHTDQFVLCGGVPVARTADAPALCATLRRLRASGGLPYDVTVSNVARGDVLPHVSITFDHGASTRPLVVAAQLARFAEMPPSQDMWTSMRQLGIVEYLATEEELGDPSILVATTFHQYYAERHHRAFTHIECHPTVIFGACSALIPFPDTNQSPRNMYQDNMVRQALGPMTGVTRADMHNTHHLMETPQKPIVSTMYSDCLGEQEEPTGQHAVMAIMPYGNTQEDAIAINKASLERGFLRYTVQRCYADVATIKGSECERFPFDPAQVEEIPERRRCDISELNPATGVPEVGSVLEAGHAIINKTYVMDDGTLHDRSTCIKRSERGEVAVDRVILTSTQAGDPAVRVRTVQAGKSTVVGDKVASRQAQKATIGVIVPQEDMPFTAGSLEEGGGMTPDILFNPHGFPSRMTVALLLEMGLGKVACKTGKRGDASAFSKMTPERLQGLLEEAGFNRSGKQRYIDGRTGEYMEMEMYDGIVYYQVPISTPHPAIPSARVSARPPATRSPGGAPWACTTSSRSWLFVFFHCLYIHAHTQQRTQRLHHFVENKAHARATGPRQIITRQPQEGRQRDGGLKTGEMEGQCFFSHGARAWLQDRLRDSSDLYECPVCATCGQIADPASRDGSVPARCRPCNSTESVRRVKLCYSMKLLSQNLAAMHVSTSFGLRDVTKEA